MQHFNQENGKKKSQNPAGGVSAVSEAVPDELVQAVEEMRREADGILVMENSKGNTILHVTGRDVEEAGYAIELDRQMLAWRLLGERSEVKTTSEQQLVYNTIKEASEALSPKEIADISGVKTGTVKKILSKFMSDQSIHRTTYGRYTIRERI